MIMFKKVVALLAVMTFALSCSAAEHELPATDIEFATIDKGANSGFGMASGRKISKVQLFVFKSFGKFESFWAQHHANRSPLPPLPKIDFDKEMATVVLDVQHSSGGYSVEVKELSETPDQLIVTATKSSPGSSCMLTQAFTQPYHIIKIVKSNKPVTLSLQEVVKDCK